MLLRVSLSNLFSFNELTEFNMLTGNVRRFEHHVNRINGLEILKFGLIYGANGAGKSNLIKAIELFAESFSEGEIIFNNEDMYKFSEDPLKKASIELEFLSNEKIYIYGIDFNDSTITSEYLYYSGLGKTKDKLIIEKTINDNGDIIIDFGGKFKTSKQSKNILEIISKNILKKNQLIVSKIRDFDLPQLQNELDDIYDWFSGLSIIYPKSKPLTFLYNLSDSEDFLNFSNDILKTIDVGISRLEIEEFTLKEYFGENDKKAIREIQEQIDEHDVDGFIPYELDVLILNEDNKITVKVLKIVHSGGNNKEVKFSLKDESDGTRRLIEYLSLLFSLTIDQENFVYIIDEIERSIHPYLLKCILEKLTSHKSVTGQLIFTTHESNLMDQSLFRTDEIWLTEKNDRGETSFAPLSNFNLRSDLDLKKGYMNGRFGAIPILANFEDLNWVSDAS